MAIQKTTTPYELLVRWGEGGVITGAHVKFLEVLDDAGVVINRKEGQAILVSLAGESGYPLADILSTVQTSALITAETAQAELAAEKAAHDAVKAELITEKAAHDVTKAELAAHDAVKAELITEKAAHDVTKAELAAAIGVA